jgi:hypothetical protein
MRTPKKWKNSNNATICIFVSTYVWTYRGKVCLEQIWLYINGPFGNMIVFSHIFCIIKCVFLHAPLPFSQLHNAIAKLTGKHESSVQSSRCVYWSAFDLVHIGTSRLIIVHSKWLANARGECCWNGHFYFFLRYSGFGRSIVVCELLSDQLTCSSYRKTSFSQL